jgi:hypothetical protein
MIAFGYKRARGVPASQAGTRFVSLDYPGTLANTMSLALSVVPGDSKNKNIMFEDQHSICAKTAEIFVEMQPTIGS